VSLAEKALWAGLAVFAVSVALVMGLIVADGWAALGWSAAYIATPLLISAVLHALTAGDRP
jgi:hypothetical protein